MLAPRAHGLRHPVPVYVLGLLFLFAPFGNIALSLRDVGLASWYSPTLWVRAWREGLPLLDRIYLGLVFSTGVLLLRPRKSSWLFGLATLAVSLVVNAINGLKGASLPSSFAILACITTLGAFGMLYYFRYPYIDRREGYWGMHPRHRAESLIVKLSPQNIAMKLENISYAGCLLAGDGKALGDLKLEDTTSIAGLPGFEARGRIARLHENKVGIHFEDLTGDEKKALKAYLDTLPEI